MRTFISNKIYIYEASAEIFQWCEENLVLNNPDYITMMRLGKEDTVFRKGIPEKIRLYIISGCDLILPFGTLPAIWHLIKNSPYTFKFNDHGQVINQNMKISMPLYDYQEEATQRLLSAKGGILQASAGSGKTQIGIELIKRLGKNALWLCGKTDLLNQTVDRIHKLYPNLPVGTITDGKIKMVKDGITVSTIQTLVNVDPDVYRNDFDAVIVDECHRCISEPTKLRMFGKVIEKIAARYKYGLTATPSRSDTLLPSMYAMLGCNLDGDFKPLFVIEKEKTNTLTAKHVRIDLDTPFSYATLDESGMFDYAALIDFLGNDKNRNEAIVDNIIKVMDIHKKQLVLCNRIDQCETINKMLQERGINSVLLIGKVSDKKRKDILNSNIDWNVIVATLSLAKEGLDIPELSCLHWAMVIGDKVATIQSAGRIERICEGKPEPVIYDYVDKNYPYCLGKYKCRVTFLRKR